jgi:hypothetical protein
MTSCAHFHSMIDELVAGKLARDGWRALHEHAAGCQGCRDRYNRTVLAARMLAGGPAAARRQLAVEAAGIARVVIPQIRAPLGARLRRFLFSPRLAVPLAATAATAAFLLILRPHPSAERWNARGGAERTIAVRAFCLTDQAVTALDPATQPPRCPATAQLKLTATNHGRHTQLFVVGVDSAYRIKWYAPRPPQTASVPLAASGATDEPVGAAIRIGVNHRPGPLRIYGLFSDRPVFADEVRSAVGDLEGRQVPIDRAVELPLSRDDVEALSLLVEIVP